MFMMIRFDGLCCHIKPPHTITVPRRVVLPIVPAHHTPHITYLEMYPADIDMAANPGWTFETYTRDNIDYVRVDVSNVKIELVNPILSPALDEHPSFAQRIPKLQDVSTTFGTLVPDLLQATIPNNVVKAYVDISNGTLAAGPSEPFRTEFFNPVPVWPTKHLAMWAQLEVDINVSAMAPTFRFTDLGSLATRDLVLHRTADLVTIGNQMEDDILGIPITTPRPGHFEVYYDLGVNVTVRPQVRVGLGMGTGCSNSGWP